MKIKKIAFLFLIIGSCLINLNYAQNGANELIGAWKGGLIRCDKVEDSDLQLRLLSKRDDDSIELSMIYELGPRSRVWSYDTDIKVDNNNISWFAHKGTLNSTKDTMWVEKYYGGEKSYWMFVRDKNSDPMLLDIRNSGTDQFIYSTPKNTDDGWMCSSIETTPLNLEKISALILKITAKEYEDIHSILIAYKNQLVFEEYFAEYGKRNGPKINSIFRDKLHHLASTTKGITSLITGIAIEKQLIERVDAPIQQYLPNFKKLFTSIKFRISVEDLLTMRSGLEWEQFKYPFSDRKNDGGNLVRSDDVIKYILNKPMITEPGKKFNYSNGDPTLLGEIIKYASGMEVDQFAARHLFTKLGIFDFLWTRYSDGTIETDGGLALTSRDLLKIGQLILNKGMWNGEQIVSEKWVIESTKKRLNINLTRGYGYYWNQKYTQSNEIMSIIFLCLDMEDKH